MKSNQEAFKTNTEENNCITRRNFIVNTSLAGAGLLFGQSAMQLRRNYTRAKWTVVCLGL